MKGKATVCTAMVKSIVDLLVNYGVDQRKIQSTVQFDLEELLDPDARVPMDHLVRLEKAAADLAQDPAIGLWMGQQCVGDGSHSGIVGYIAAHCATVGQGFRQAIRYSNLLGDAVHLELKEEGDRAEFLYLRDDPAECSVLGAELALASTVTTLGQLGGQAFQLVETHFQHPTPAYFPQYRPIFGPVLRFQQAENKVIFRAAVLELKSPHAQPYIQQILTEHAGKLLDQLDPDRPYSRMVRKQIVATLPWGPVSVDEAAAALGMSRQTLYRRLKAEGTSFQGLLDNTRQKLVDGYLKNDEYAISEIAFLLGFAEYSSFHRAFRRWYRENPKEYREKVVGNG